MKSYLVAPLLLLAAGLAGCVNMTGWQTVHGSGNVVSETREVSQFDRVSVSGAGELTIEQGDEESLSIEADDNLLPYLRSEVDRGRLSIGPQNVNLRPTQTIRYRLQLRRLNELHLSGSVRAEAPMIKTERLVLRISGSGSMNIGQLDSRALSTDISGSGRISAAGRVETQELNISGSGDQHTPDLQCSQAQAHISGSGRAWLWVVESLKAEISGSGRVEYRGKPDVDSHVSGSGRVRHIADAK